MSEPILEISGVSKNFGGIVVLQDVSFKLKTGAKHALIGPNGAGKTTMFNVISGVYQQDAGEVIFAGKSVSDVPSRKRISFGLARSFQNIRLMPHLSVVENVMLGQHSQANFIDMLKPIMAIPKSNDKQKAIELLESFGLNAFNGRLVSELPYGVRKKIEVVRALMANPRLLLLDEPAAGLNAAETATLHEFLSEVGERGVTLLVVEHDMPFVNKLCDTVTVMNFGRVIYDGPVSAMRKDKDVLEAYLGTDE